MAYDVYYRYGATSLKLDGISAPNFPNRAGLSLYTNPTVKPKYTHTERYYGITDISWNTDYVKSTKRDAIYSFWNTTLSAGYNDFSVIDNRSRMLFDASWNDWGERWRKSRGGVYDIEYNLQSPVPWTPPLFGCYPLSLNSLANHNLSGDDLAAVDGAILANAGDAAILSLSGYALRLTGSAAQDTGASGTVSWRSGNQKNSLSLFGQIRLPAVNSELYLISIDDGTNAFRLIAESDDASNNLVSGVITTGGVTSYITKADTTKLSIPINTWYDFAVTYDSINGDIYVYYAPANNSSFTQFLDTQTNIETGIISTQSTPGTYPSDTEWQNVYALRETATGTLTNSANAYMQNMFIVDDFITPQEFNNLRRLCYMWNSKTSGVWPK